MALTQAQRQAAQLIMRLGAQQGLSLARQRELVAAAYAESGLNPNATNRSSGAAGFFQLLSSGYRNRAKQLGGLYNPRANVMAILPDYVRYWQQHPNAAAGEAGRDVERSGQGASFYANPLSLLGGVAPGAASATTTGRPPTGPGAAAPGVSSDLYRRALAAMLMNRGDTAVDWKSLIRARRQDLAAQAASTPAVSNPGNRGAQLNVEAPGAPAAKATGSKHALAEAFYDPLGSWDSGRFGGPIGGHSDHVHLSITNPQVMLSAISWAQQHGLRVGENPYTSKVYPVHVKGSYHYRDFPGKYGGKTLGEAVDVTGTPAQMAAYYRWATGHLR